MLVHNIVKLFELKYKSASMALTVGRCAYKCLCVCVCVYIYL